MEYATEIDAVAQTLPDAEVASLAAQHTALRERLAALQGETSAAAAAADLQARLADFDAEIAAGARRQRIRCFCFALTCDWQKLPSILEVLVLRMMVAALSLRVGCLASWPGTGCAGACDGDADTAP